MKVVLLAVAVSLAAMAAGEAPSSSYGAPSRQPQPQPQSQFQRQQAQPKAQPQAQPKTQPQQPQAFAQSQAQPSFASPLSLSPLYAAGSLPFGRQFFIPAPEASRVAELNRLPNEYGPPTATFTTTEAAPTTTEVPTTISPADFGFAGSRSAALREAEESGVYYVLQPDGRLHRVAYSHGPAAAAAPASAASQRQRAAPSEVSALEQPALTPAYLARFHYQEIQPAGAPIYTYGKPELVRVN